MLIHAQLEDSSEKRQSRRRVVRLEGKAASKRTGREAYVAIRDLSETGFLIEAAVPFTTGEKIGVAIADTLSDAEVVWQSGRFVGCRFDRTLSKSQLSAALLKSRPTASERPAADIEIKLQSARAHLAQISEELDDVERGLRVKRTLSAVDLDVGVRSGDNPAHVEERLPLAVRAWTVLITSLVLWTLLLWGAGLL